MSTQVRSEPATQRPTTPAVEMKLEVVVVPVSDVDRAKQFYVGLGWRLDADLAADNNSRVVQLTPTGSQCSIHLRQGSHDGRVPGSIHGTMLVVSDIQTARAALIGRGVAVSEVFHYGTKGRVSGRDPAGRSYATWASFNDPDGNGWLLQEIKTRLPGRV